MKLSERLRKDAELFGLAESPGLAMAAREVEGLERTVEIVIKLSERAGAAEVGVAPALRDARRCIAYVRTFRKSGRVDLANDYLELARRHRENARRARRMAEADRARVRELLAAF